jgi:hypothetical protein
VTTATATKPLTITLPYCEVCGRVGRLPNANWGGKTACTGAPGHLHKRHQMVPKTFVETSA